MSGTENVQQGLLSIHRDTPFQKFLGPPLNNYWPVLASTGKSTYFVLASY